MTWQPTKTTCAHAHDGETSLIVKGRTVVTWQPTKTTCVCVLDGETSLVVEGVHGEGVLSMGDDLRVSMRRCGGHGDGDEMLLSTSDDLRVCAWRNEVLSLTTWIGSDVAMNEDDVRVCAW